MDFSKPAIWSHNEVGGFSWPAKRAVAKFRKDIEAAEKSTKSQPALGDLKLRVEARVTEICKDRKISTPTSSEYAKRIWSQISGDTYMLNRVASGDYSDVTRLLDSLLAKGSSDK